MGVPFFVVDFEEGREDHRIAPVKPLLPFCFAPFSFAAVIGSVFSSVSLAHQLAFFENNRLSFPSLVIYPRLASPRSKVQTRTSQESVARTCCHCWRYKTTLCTCIAAVQSPSSSRR